jgi:hypothetical protein
MKLEKLYELEIDQLEKLIEYVEQEADNLEVTADYYIMEFL